MTKKPILIALLATVAGLAAPAGAQALTVYAAASLRDAFPKIDGAATYSFLGSNQLQAQIERGAPADVFASASPNETRALFRAGLCTRPVTFATNVVVLITPKGNPGHVRSVYSLRTGSRRLSVGTAGVPIGAYTRQVLARLRLTSILRTNRVSLDPNVAAITSKVGLGSADAGFVYATDAKSVDDRTDTVSLPGGRSRRSATGCASCAAPASTPRPRTPSSRRSGPRTAAGSSGATGSACRRAADREDGP
jgi:molybdate transport system substrate-binding protein